MKRSQFKPKHKCIPSIELKHYKRVAELPCAECGVEGYSQCAHSNSFMYGKGLGLKSNYLATFPLCCVRPGIVGCHQTHDLLIGITREQQEQREDRYIQDTHEKLNITWENKI